MFGCSERALGPRVISFVSIWNSKTQDQNNGIEYMLVDDDTTTMRATKTHIVGGVYAIARGFQYLSMMADCSLICCVGWLWFVHIAIVRPNAKRLGLVVDGFIYPVNFEFHTRHIERHYFSHTAAIWTFTIQSVWCIEYRKIVIMWSLKTIELKSNKYIFEFDCSSLKAISILR